MKKEDLFSLIGEADEQKVVDANTAHCFAKKFPWLKWGAMAACLCLVVVGAYVSHTVPGGGEAQKGGITEPNGVPAENISETARPANTVSISLSDIFVNELSDTQVDATRLWRDPDLYEEVFWNENAVMEYYGKNLTPAYIPEGLLPAPGNGSGHVYIQKSDGKVIEDGVWLGFYHAYYEDGSPRLTDDVAAPKGFHLCASKLGLIEDCIYILPENEVKASDIGGTAVTIGYRSMPYGPYDADSHEPCGYYDVYVAEFSFNDIDYQIVADQMMKEDLIRVVASIVCGDAEIEITE